MCGWLVGLVVAVVVVGGGRTLLRSVELGVENIRGWGLER